MTYRNTDTHMWRDEWFGELSIEEKLLFIYMFTNESTTLTGVYKISLKVIEFETGLSKDFIIQTFDRFARDGKVFYDNGIVWVVNLRKYNDSRSPKVQSRINWELSQIPDCIIKIRYITGNIQYPYSMDTDSTLTLTESLTVAGAQAPPTSFPPIPTVQLAEQIYTSITSHATFPSQSRDRDIERICAIYDQQGANTQPYLKRFYDAWKERRYNPINTSWLDWAVADHIPDRKNGSKPPEETATEVYQ